MDPQTRVQEQCSSSDTFACAQRVKLCSVICVICVMEVNSLCDTPPAAGETPMYMLPNPYSPKNDTLIAGRRDRGVGGKEWNAERHWHQLRDPVVPSIFVLQH